MRAPSPDLRTIPSVDEVLKTAAATEAVERYGRLATVAAVRQQIDLVRQAVASGAAVAHQSADIAGLAAARLEDDSQLNVRPVFNLTGTVLHTNLGRAVLSDAAIAAATDAMRDALALEFDLQQGKRGERDALLRDLLRELTGAEDATIVNNNAAAVLLVLNTLADGREAIVSRGELIEIGGAFRMPEIMARAGARLVEVGTTNRTHEKDYAEAIGPETGVVLKVHTSNYRIEGFTKAVSAKSLSTMARAANVPLVNDLGSGTLADLARYGLTHEPTVAEAVAEGADLVTFSGDKLLGGPQAGFIVGRRDLIEKINKNPMKRALRMDKIRLAALEATLKLYRDPDRLAERLPTIKHIARRKADIETVANRLLAPIAVAVGENYEVTVVACASQIGSGALPLETIPSAGIAIRSVTGRGSGQALQALAADLRRLPIPIIGRIEDQTIILDLRCLENEDRFTANLARLEPAGGK
jgi:L-seryl-tRNA(Ser) seleniumtransferase